MAHLQRGGGNASLAAPQIKPLPPRRARPPFRPSAGAQPESRRAGGGGAGAPRPRGYRPGAATGRELRENSKYLSSRATSRRSPRCRDRAPGRETAQPRRGSGTGASGTRHGPGAGAERRTRLGVRPGRGPGRGQAGLKGRADVCRLEGFSPLAPWRHSLRGLGRWPLDAIH